jgi:hypothetical protein
MFLDGLVLHRRSLNLPALSMQWGVLEGVGYVAKNATTIGVWCEKGYNIGLNIYIISFDFNESIIMK